MVGGGWWGEGGGWRVVREGGGWRVVGGGWWVEVLVDHKSSLSPHQVAVKTMPFYARYFDTPYCLPKLDLIAIPELGFG